MCHCSPTESLPHPKKACKFSSPKEFAGLGKFTQLQSLVTFYPYGRISSLLRNDNPIDNMNNPVCAFYIGL